MYEVTLQMLYSIILPPSIMIDVIIIYSGIKDRKVEFHLEKPQNLLCQHSGKFFHDIYKSGSSLVFLPL